MDINASVIPPINITIPGAMLRLKIPRMMFAVTFTPAWVIIKVITIPLTIEGTVDPLRIAESRVSW